MLIHNNILYKKIVETKRYEMKLKMDGGNCHDYFY